MTEPKKKKKKKKPNPVLDYLLYILVRLVAIFVQLPDTKTSVRIARHLGAGLYLIYHRGRQRAIDNLRVSFPDKDQTWIEQTARRSFEHISMLAFDVLRTIRLITVSTWHRYIELGDFSQVLPYILNNRGIIMLTGHYGNFEVLGYAMAIFGLESYSIARPIDNPYINEYLMGVRQRHGQKIIDKKGATDSMLDLLDSGSTLSFIADQNAGKKGIFVDFFGRKASTYKSIGLLAMEYNLPVVIGYCRRINNQYQFKIGLTRIITPQDWQDKPNPLRWITAEYTAAIEQFVREDPDQYWWVHRRWKTRPPEERNA
ncbi:MAG: lysophospholipid acyltransferase family protein [Sedimentisphaerales bacterium]|nr:lysophospholipid acyltransferase family protein [Sedimentisphaerales bacterium]